MKTHNYAIGTFTINHSNYNRINTYLTNVSTNYQPYGLRAASFDKTSIGVCKNAKLFSSVDDIKTHIAKHGIIRSNPYRWLSPYNNRCGGCVLILNEQNIIIDIKDLHTGCAVENFGIKVFLKCDDDINRIYQLNPNYINKTKLVTNNPIETREALRSGEELDWTAIAKRRGLL